MIRNYSQATRKNKARGTLLEVSSFMNSSDEIKNNYRENMAEIKVKLLGD